MNGTVITNDQYEKDRTLTLRNRAHLNSNKNLLYWYRQLYREQFCELPDISSMRILEIGSGVSPLKQLHSSVLTSDVLQLDYLDYVFDCHEIDHVAQIPNESIDVIALTNVLHHLKNPIDFLRKATSKLKVGGQIIATEPYISSLSVLIFKYLHHEPLDLSAEEPVLADVKGPLASANIALPWLIFCRKPAWRDRLCDLFDCHTNNFRAFSALSYMATGGISRRIPIPPLLYRLLFHLDLLVSRAFPRMVASFFTIRLTRK